MSHFQVVWALGLAVLSLGADTSRVERVIDGDTLVLQGGERVRLIGVDTPETHHRNAAVEIFGHEAAAFTRREIAGREVRLEKEWPTQDRFGRTLAYVYRVPDDFFLNAEIIQQGYGFATPQFPFTFLEDFRRYERQARESGRGLWTEEGFSASARKKKKGSPARR